MLGQRQVDHQWFDVHRAQRTRKLAAMQIQQRTTDFDVVTDRRLPFIGMHSEQGYQAPDRRATLSVQAQ